MSHKVEMPFPESLLKSMRGLTQFERCWGIIDSHIELYKRYKAIRERESELALIAARWEAICDILNGEEPSDFMLSFPDVREVTIYSPMTALDIKNFLIPKNQA